jgi:guanidinopropionase
MDREIIPPTDSLRVPRFAEIATFLRAPRMTDLSRVDVGLCGVPFDLAVTFRSGTRLGPEAIRQASRLTRRVNHSTGVDPFALAQVADLGDAPTHPLDLSASLDLIASFYGTLRDNDVRPISAGGDHAITLPILRGLHRGEPVAFVQIDAHTDLYDTFFEHRYNHATPFRRAIEEGLIDPKRMIQVGLRSSHADIGPDRIYGREVGVRMVTYDEYEELGRATVIEEIRRVAGDGPVYLSFDIDGLDPSHAPGTGVPEPGGLSMRDAQVILRSLSGLDIIGADVVEVVPTLDPAGMTAINAAHLMFELLCLIAPSAGSHRQGEPR